MGVDSAGHAGGQTDPPTLDDRSAGGMKRDPLHRDNGLPVAYAAQWLSARLDSATLLL